MPLLDRSEAVASELTPQSRPKCGEWRRVIIISEINGGEYETETVVVVAEAITSIRIEAVE